MKDGWFHTGDEGYFDVNENVFVVGRFKELIKYRMAHVGSLIFALILENNER